MLCACSGAANNAAGAGSASPSSEKGTRFGVFGSIARNPAKSLDDKCPFWFHEVKNGVQKSAGSAELASLGGRGFSFGIGQRYSMGTVDPELQTRARAKAPLKKVFEFGEKLFVNAGNISLASAYYFRGSALNPSCSGRLLRRAPLCAAPTLVHNQP